MITGFSFRNLTLASLIILIITSCSSRPELPELSTEYLFAESEQSIVVSADYFAARAGTAILQKGGNAVDAAVAVQMVLTLTEPSESGIGGGGFLYFMDGESGEMIVYDGRETAPAAAKPNRFQFLGFNIPHWRAIPTGQSVGVPGTLAMLYKAHQNHGLLPWSELFVDAIEFAQNGVPAPPKLLLQIDNDPSLRLFGNTRRYFRPLIKDENPQLRNPELAETLREISIYGPDVFYHGEIGADVVEAAGSRWPRSSDMTARDLESYTALVRNPVCGSYREFTICGPPPPSSGGIALIQMLGMLEPFDLANTEPMSSLAVHLIAEVSRLAFADRYHHLGDPDFTEIPVEQLIDPEYLAERSSLIQPDLAMRSVYPGLQAQFPKDSFQGDAESGGTSHFSIIDKFGNAVAMTGSIETQFGSRIMTRGFLLNNQLTDFRFNPDYQGGLHPNAVEPGKRPRSSMSPVMVFDADGELYLTLGSRGGSRIIGYVLKTLIGVLDWNLPIDEAIALPNVIHMGDRLELEQDRFSDEVVRALREKGHRPNLRSLDSGLQGIKRIPNGWRGGADPRIGGAAISGDGE